jgi:hypothetical protein
VAGGTYFFTVALLERERDLLVAEIAALLDAVRRVKRLYPFGIVAWVVLPDHLHCIWALPVGDADYPTRWRLIKLLFANDRTADSPIGMAVWRIKSRVGCIPCTLHGWRYDMSVRLVRGTHPTS